MTACPVKMLYETSQHQASWDGRGATKVGFKQPGQMILMVHLHMEKVSLNAQKCISGAIGWSQLPAWLEPKTFHRKDARQQFSVFCRWHCDYSELAMPLSVLCGKCQNYALYHCISFIGGMATCSLRCICKTLFSVKGKGEVTAAWWTCGEF